MKFKKAVSSKDVAREAGVSQATVSYILNENKNVRVKPETREAVLAAIKKLDYHPNEIARGMRLNKSMSIGIITERNITNFYFMKSLEGIKDVSQKHNYSITLLFDMPDGKAEEEFIKFFESRRLDGVIFVFASPKEETIIRMREREIPFVVLDSQPIDADIHQVCTDHLERISEVVEMLSLKNVKKIAYVGPLSKNGFDARPAVFKNCIENSSFKWEDELLNLTVHEESEILKELCAILSRIERPDAILAGTPRYGLYTARCAQFLNITVPEELKLVALGSSNFYTVAHPPVSSIEVPLYEMGINAAEMLVGLMQGEIVKKSRILPSELVLRHSI